MAIQVIYEFNANLDDYIYGCSRRFQIKASKTMTDLAYVLMTLFEMKGTHLFNFRVDLQESFINNVSSFIDSEKNQMMLNMYKEESTSQIFIEIPNEFSVNEEGLRVYDARKTYLKNVLDHEGEKLYFSYDFGDGWNFTLRLEKIIVSTTDKHPSKHYPYVLEGKGFGIIEDCGGISGLEDIYLLCKDKDNPKYTELCQWWRVDELNLNQYDNEEMNVRLKKLPRMFKEIYENDNPISENGLDLLFRQ